MNRIKSWIKTIVTRLLIMHLREPECPLLLQQATRSESISSDDVSILINTTSIRFLNPHVIRLVLHICMKAAGSWFKKTRKKRKGKKKRFLAIKKNKQTKTEAWDHFTSGTMIWFVQTCQAIPECWMVTLYLNYLFIYFCWCQERQRGSLHHQEARDLMPEMPLKYTSNR